MTPWQCQVALAAYGESLFGSVAEESSFAVLGQASTEVMAAWAPQSEVARRIRVSPLRGESFSHDLVRVFSASLVELRIDLDAYHAGLASDFIESLA